MCMCWLNRYCAAGGFGDRRQSCRASSTTHTSQPSQQFVCGSEKVLSLCVCVGSTATAQVDPEMGGKAKQVPPPPVVSCPSSCSFCFRSVGFSLMNFILNLDRPGRGGRQSSWRASSTTYSSALSHCFFGFPISRFSFNEFYSQPLPPR